MSFYDFLVFVHIFSAILGLGPGFFMIFVVKNANNMTELRHAFKIRDQLHMFTMIGGTLLLVSGLIMGFMKPFLFTRGWYVISLGLFLLVLIAGSLVLKPKSAPIKQMLKTHQGEEIPKEYDEKAKALFFYERLTNIVFLIIIALMILKPF